MNGNAEGMVQRVEMKSLATEASHAPRRGKPGIFNHQPPCGDKYNRENEMAKGLIAIVGWQECHKCINLGRENKCKFRDSVKLNLKMDGPYIRCGLFKEIDKCES